MARPRAPSWRRRPASTSATRGNGWGGWPARFTLPPEHVPVLAEEAGPVYFGGAHQMLLGTFGVLDQLTAAFQQGGGVPQPQYSEDWWAGMECFSAGWFENLLLPQWIPAMPRVREALERGADVADVGC